MRSNPRSNQTHSVVAIDLDTGLCLLLGGLGNVHRDCRLGQDDIGDNGVTHNVELLDQGVTMVKQMATWQDEQHSKISQNTDQLELDRTYDQPEKSRVMSVLAQCCVYLILLHHPSGLTGVIPLEGQFMRKWHGGSITA